MAQRPKGRDGSTIRVMPAPVPSAWADNTNNNGSVSINDVTPVAASKPQMGRNGHCREPVKGPWAIPQSQVWTSKATTPPGEHVVHPGEALAIKEAADGHVTGPWTMTRSPGRTSKATMSPGKLVARPGEALAIKKAANAHDDLCHGMAPL
jgi:hypothetical protein